jgi:anaerobic selenocysteine-containing dehydrogenase
VLQELAARVRPDLRERVTFDSTAAIRAEIARVIPAYDGIQNLRAKGDQFQWGGPRLAEGGRFGFADRRARFVPVSPPAREIPEGWFHLTTRRGKQFNSMVLADRDMLTGSDRDTVLMAPEDMERLGLADRAPVVLRSRTGRFRGRAAAGGVRPGTVIMTWPEANALIPRGDVDPVCGIPAYRDTAVEVRPETAGSGSGTP